MHCVTVTFTRVRENKQKKSPAPLPHKRHLAENKTDSSMLITVHFACTCVWAENPFY